MKLEGGLLTFWILLLRMPWRHSRDNEEYTNWKRSCCFPLLNCDQLINVLPVSVSLFLPSVSICRSRRSTPLLGRVSSPKDSSSKRIIIITIIEESYSADSSQLSNNPHRPIKKINTTRPIPSILPEQAQPAKSQSDQPIPRARNNKARLPRTLCTSIPREPLGTIHIAHCAPS